MLAVAALGSRGGALERRRDDVLAAMCKLL
jgi:hypothetical protein